MDITETSHARPKKPKPNLQLIKFVNTSKLAVSDRRTTKPNRAHVTRDIQRRKREHERYSDKITDGRPFIIPTTHSCNEILPFKFRNPASPNVSSPQQLFTSLDPFSTFPIEMEPYMYTLLQRCKPATPQKPRGDILPNLFNRHLSNFRPTKATPVENPARFCSPNLAFPGHERRRPIPFHSLRFSDPYRLSRRTKNIIGNIKTYERSCVFAQQKATRA